MGKWCARSSASSAEWKNSNHNKKKKNNQNKNLKKSFLELSFSQLKKIFKRSSAVRTPVFLS